MTIKSIRLIHLIMFTVVVFTVASADAAAAFMQSLRYQNVNTCSDYIYNSNVKTCLNKTSKCKTNTISVVFIVVVVVATAAVVATLF